MKRYKLKIPEMTRSNQAGFIACLNRYLGENQTITRKDVDAIEKRFNEVVLFDWLEEIPKEPKVLTAEDYMCVTFGFNDCFKQSYEYEGMCNSFNKGTKNGQLIEYLSPKQVQLRKALTGLIDKIELFMKTPSCNDFLPHIKFAKESLDRLNHVRNRN